MKKFLKFFLCSFLAVSLVGCSDDSSDDGGSSIPFIVKVSPTSLSIEADGTAQDVTVTNLSNATITTDITYTDGDGWLTVTDNGSNSFSVSASENTGSSYRYASVKFTGTLGSETTFATLTITQYDDSEPFAVGQVYYENEVAAGVIYYVSADESQAIVINYQQMDKDADWDSATYRMDEWTATNYYADVEDAAAEFSGLYSDLSTESEALFAGAIAAEVIKNHPRYSNDDSFEIFKWATSLGEDWYIPTNLDLMELAAVCGLSTTPDYAFDAGASGSGLLNWNFEDGATNFYDVDNVIDAALYAEFGDSYLPVNEYNRYWSCNMVYQHNVASDDGSYELQLMPWCVRFDQYRSVPIQPSSTNVAAIAVKYLSK